MIEVNWTASTAASAYYTASVLARAGVPVDGRLSQILAAPTAALAAGITEAGISPDEFWRQIVPLAAEIEDHRELAGQAFLRSTGHPPTDEVVTQLAEQLRALREVFEEAVPDVQRQLTLRAGPLRELWEGRGPGLLAAIGRMTDRGLIVERATALPVTPISGGGGDAYAGHGKVAIEAVLANPHPDLPEVARLGWLIARLGCELPGFGSAVSKSRLPWIVSVAMISPALAAAEYVELAQLNPSTLQRALQVWHVVEPSQVDDTAAMLDRWWRTYQEERVPWGVALAALDQILAAD
ncbi:MAG TPA: hypothetical protein VGN12_25005 [Pirellulales bacterium]